MAKKKETAEIKSPEVTETKEEVNKFAGIPMSEEENKAYEKVFTDIEESIEYCKKHPVKLDNKKK